MFAIRGCVASRKGIEDDVFGVLAKSGAAGGPVGHVPSRRDPAEEQADSAADSDGSNFLHNRRSAGEDERPFPRAPRQTKESVKTK